MRIRRLWSLSLLLAGVLAALPAGAESRRIPWEELPQAMKGRLVDRGQLGVRDCPAGAAARPADRRVLQIIENVFYSWEERDLPAAQGGGLCIVMRQPLAKALSAAEAQVLLSASARWSEKLAPSPEAQTLSPDDPALRAVPDVWWGSKRELPADGRGLGNLDRGIVRRLPAADKSGAANLEDATATALPVADPIAGGKSIIARVDDRRRVTGTGTFPYNGITYLTFRRPGDPGSYRASGFLVSPYMVLTNGHVVWDARSRGFAEGLTLAPGQAQGSAGGPVTRPFGTRNATRLATNAGWVETQRIEFDYSAAFFDTPFAGISTFMPLVFDVSPAANAQVSIAGYPGAVRNENTQGLWQDDDGVQSVQGRVLRYKNDTSPGDSGSPVWQVVGGQRRAIAIHSTGDPLGVANSGARLVAQNLDLLEEWLAWTPATQRGLHLTINQVDPTDCPAVRAVVSVTDDTGKPIVDLTGGNFTLSENGVPQRISVGQAEARDAPVAIALLLDASSSLSDTDINNIKVASRAFVDLLGPRDKMAVYHFGTQVDLVQDYTSDKARLKTAINGLDNLGATALYDAVVEAADHSTTAVGRRALVVMTDGEDTASGSSLNQAIAAANSARVPAFTIGFGFANPSVLSAIANQTGGRFFLGASSSDLANILRSLNQTLDNQYILSWLTSFHSGGTEGIEVAVQDGGNRDQKSDDYSQSGTACQPASTCNVQVLSPNGGEVWTKGTPQTVRWSATGPACGGVGIGLFNGADVWPLVDTTGNDGAESFNIDFLPASPDYRALVVDRATGAFDVSDGTFALDVAPRSLVCRQGPDTLCLRQGRFQVRVLWHPPSGFGGLARAVPLTGGDAGYFWFFESSNPEIFTRAIDTRSTNGHFAFYSGALTNVRYSIFVTDSQTGATRVYTNQTGDFVSFADATAFGPAPEAAETDREAKGAEAPAGAPTGRGTPVAERAFSTANVLWGQADAGSTSVVSSENRLDAGAGAYSTEAADDFVVPAGRTWDVKSVDAGGAYYGNGPRGPAQSVNVLVYNDQNGAPGGARCTYSNLQPARGLSTGSFEITLPQACRLPAGRYWLSVQANQNYTLAGQWGWQERSQQRERRSLWRNPGNGYSTGCSNWGSLDACHIDNQPDLVFQVHGQVVTGGTANCTASTTALCLNNRRFKVEVTFKNAAGANTAAKAVSVAANNGYFWFTAASQPEVAVKVLDGQANNGSFWVFLGGITTTEFTLKVTDTATGRVRTYTSPKNQATSLADTLAFPGP